MFLKMQTDKYQQMGFPELSRERAGREGRRENYHIYAEVNREKQITEQKRKADNGAEAIRKIRVRGSRFCSPLYTDKTLLFISLWRNLTMLGRIISHNELFNANRAIVSE